ncbi:MAG: hypothetical protein KBT02_02795 [Treponema sp.]|nr:hypothetical protein [Candidatus Treponema caballi]
MAIQPIDLQTLYTQLENVSKNVAFQQQGMQFKGDMQETERARQEFLKKQAVTKAHEEEELADTVKERKGNNGQQQQNTKKQMKEEEESEKPVEEIQIRDTSLGRIIDILG